MKKVLFAFCALVAQSVFALDPVALTNAALHVKTVGLESEHSADIVMAGAAESGGWTQQDCTDVLYLAYQLGRWSTNSFESGSSCHAITLMADFGGTNAAPRLVSIMQNDVGFFREWAGRKYVRVCTRNPFPGWEEPLRAEIARSSAAPGDFSWIVYDYAGFDLKYMHSDPVWQRTILRFLLEQAVRDAPNGAVIDDILCREVPRWRGSARRAENAERMVREHPDDAALAAFFGRVAANARAVAATTPPPRVSRSAAQALREGDPWADLLEDLPVKKRPAAPPVPVIAH